MEPHRLILGLWHQFALQVAICAIIVIHSNLTVVEILWDDSADRAL